MSAKGFIMVSFLLALSFYFYANMPEFIVNSGVGIFAYMGLFIADIIALFIIPKW